MFNQAFSTVAKHVHAILVQMMTGDKANEQTCPFRVWGTLGFLTLVVFMGAHLWMGHPFNAAEYGGAMAAYLVAWGGAIYAKDKVGK